MESKRSEVIGGFFQSVLRRMNPMTAMALVQAILAQPSAGVANRPCTT